jgi:putative spermidine/putrescine transport system permease protein
MSLLALAAPGTAFLLLFFFVPLAVLPWEAFSEGGDAFQRVFRDSIFWKGLCGSLVLGTLAPFFSLVVGFCIAMFLARRKASLRAPLLFLISLPLTFSGLIVAYGFILVFGRSGFLTLLLAKLGADPAVVGAFIYSPVGLGFAYSYYLIPRAVMILLPVILNFDPSQLLAAESLGASRFRAHLDVLLPQIMPSILATFCLISAVAIGAYGTALALVGTQVNILPLLLYSKISETGSDFPAAAALSIVLMAITSAVMTLAEIFGRASHTAPFRFKRG